MQSQMEVLPHYAAPVYLEALERLELPRDHIPQGREVSAKLFSASGWSLVPVPALIDFSTFFEYRNSFFHLDHDFHENAQNAPTFDRVV